MNSLPIAIDVSIWYVSSVICTSGSKHLLNTGVLPSGRWLTLVQLCIAAILGHILLAAKLVTEPNAGCNGSELGDRSERQRWALAATFVVGFGSLNASFSLIPASLAMTLRAAEPLFSVALVTVFMGASEHPSLQLCASLFPIVLGTSMSSFGSSQFSFSGLLLVRVANTAFPLRTVIYKKLRAATGEGNFTIFAGVCWRAAIITAAVNLFMSVFIAIFQSDENQVGGSVNHDWIATFLQSGNAIQLLLNGVCYFTYLQWSFIVLSKVTVVTHAVANAMRRPVNIIFAVWYFSTLITVINGLGIVLACAGALLYAKVKASETAAAVKHAQVHTNEHSLELGIPAGT